MKRIRTALALLLAAAVLAGCGSGVNGAKTALTVNGESIPCGLVSFEAHSEEAIFNTYYKSMVGGSITFDQDLGDGRTYGDSVVDMIIDTVKEDLVIAQHAADYGIELSEEQKAEIDRVAQTFFDNNDKETIKQIGVRKEDLVRSLELDTIHQMMYEPVVVDVDTEIDEEEVQRGLMTYVRVPAATQEDIDAGKDADEINKAAQEKLTGIYEAIVAAGGPAGADIESIVKGIDEEMIVVTNTYLVNGENPAFDELLLENVKALGEGEMTDVPFLGAKEDYYYIVRLDTLHDEESTERERKSVLSTRKNELFNEILKGWIDESTIEVNEDVVRTIRLTDNKVFTLKVEEQP